MLYSTKKLGEVCEIFNGGTPDTKKLSYWGDDYFWITPKDMGKLSDIFVEDTSRKITSAGLKNSSAKILPPNSIILSSRAPIGHLAINKVPMATNQGCKGLIPKKELDHFFLFYFLFNSVELLNKLGSGTTFKEISGSKIASIEIPTPPLPEQTRIVKILDEVFTDIAKAKVNAEKNLQNATELFESYLQSIFSQNRGLDGLKDDTEKKSIKKSVQSAQSDKSVIQTMGKDWEEKRLSDICEMEYGYTEKAKSEGGYRFVRITDTDENGLLTQEKKMYIDSFKEVNKYLLNKGDLLMARTGASAGNVLLFESNEKSVFASYLIRIKFKKDIMSRLYWFFSKSKLYWDQVGLLSAGSAQPQFNGGALKQIIFTFPKSLSEQKSIVAKLDTLSAETKKLESIYKQKIADLEELKKSILKKAFSGEL